MHRFLFLAMIGLAVVACGGGDGKAANSGAGDVYADDGGCGCEDGCDCGDGCGCGCGEEEESSGGAYTPDKGTATIKGAVQFEGKPPTRKPVDMGSEQHCVDSHSAEPLLSETVIVGENGGLANVFIHVTKAPSGWKFPKGSDEKLLDQKGCQYMPHVIGLQAGGSIRVRNSDPIMHNIHAYDLRSGRDLFNFSQTQQGSETVQSKPFRRPGIVQVKCDVHGWMGSYVCVTKYPFYAVTGEDGAFSLDKLPPGEYTIEAWQEKYGKKTSQVTVGDGETKEISFVFSR